MKFVTELKRTDYCGALTLKDLNKKVVLMGWVESRRDHGGLVFVDLRDRAGLVQVVLDPANPTQAAAKELKNEYVIAIEGIVRERPAGMRNDKLPTGALEVAVENFEILSASDVLPFQIWDPNVTENLRLKYRYLDLRSPRLQQNLRVRHQVVQVARQFLNDAGFLEIETPILYKSTPEGARDYLVPSRVHQGNFYALPQSPQTLKQLLMISGFDRYYQIARCFRDEDLRSDRQPEFSQIDMEMSFIDQEDILAVNEELVRCLWRNIKGIEIPEIQRMPFSESMERFGSDKPDMRFGMEIIDLAAVVKGSGFKVFEDVLASEDGRVRGLLVPGTAEFSRSRLDKLTQTAKDAGAKGLVWIKFEGAEKISSPVAKFLGEEKLREIMRKLGGRAGDLALIVADKFETTCAALSTLRNELGRELKLIDESKDAFLWVVDFPLLEYSAEEKRWAARHHPFTSPSDESMEKLIKGVQSDYPGLLAKAYDLVCNGYEIAGGSIRIHRNEVQQAMFNVLGLTKEETERKFGFFLEALKFGTPPHGGIAWGLDRLVMILCGTDAIREVIAFPKTTKAACLMSEAPSSVDEKQLNELGIRLK